ncbi:MAG: acyl carrier protein [Anaerolineales bacterium]|nr:acyl carrier protein [Anaerolineales bacterium]
MEANKTKIRAFIDRFVQQADLQDDDDIFGCGFVNSLFAMQLVLFIEGEFNLKLERDDLKLDNFRSVNAIARLVEHKSA